ncbi:unnamed protein product [Rhizoctonia solani]|uniref:Uncharacterized protein n=1 Tax=Rhizoctonia solani TaxID=456999 RepID=A0A8H3I0N8_9AGAM|nr:unnamed protein product [Rhizoctonia solani]
MPRKPLCHCNLIPVSAVIEGERVLVCRHLLQGAQYRANPHHAPCGFKVNDDAAPEFHPSQRMVMLYHRREAFKALDPPEGSDPLDLYRPKNEVARNDKMQAAEDVMDVDGPSIEGEGPFTLPEQRLPTDAGVWQRKCMMLERRLRDSEDERRRLKQELVELKEQNERDRRALEEQCQAQVRAKEEDANDWKRKFESVRTELRNLRRSAYTHVIASKASRTSGRD